MRAIFWAEAMKNLGHSGSSLGKLGGKAFSMKLKRCKLVQFEDMEDILAVKIGEFLAVW